MAWTHFTTLLVEGDLITTDQRNELYDAFLERAGAIAPWLGVTYAASSTLRTSGFDTDLIEMSGSTQRLVQALEAISGYYVREEVIDDAMTLAVTDSWTFFGDIEDTTNLWNRACAAAGVDTTEFTDLQSDKTLSSFKRWNVIREAIRLLKYPNLKTVSEVEKSQSAASGVDWASANADFFLSEVPGATGFGYQLTINAIYSTGHPTPWQIGGCRSIITVTVPAVAAFSSGYQLAAFLSRATIDDVGDAVRFNFYGATDVSSLPTETDRKACLISGTGKTATGDLDIDQGLLGYYDSTALDYYQTSSGDDEHHGGAYVTGYAALPTFSFT